MERFCGPWFNYFRAWLQILRARLIATNSSTESLPTLEYLPTALPPTYVTTSGQRSCNQTHGNDNQDFITIYYCLYFSYVCPVALSNDRNHEKNDEIAHCNLQSWVTVRFLPAKSTGARVQLCLESTSALWAG